MAVLQEELEAKEYKTTVGGGAVEVTGGMNMPFGL